MRSLKTIRGKLFIWYAASLIAVTAFFYLAIHIFALPYGNLLFIVLLIILAVIGLLIIRKMTNKLISLSSKIKSITSNNLNEKITGIENEDEIGELAVSFNQLLERLDESFKRDRQFIGDVAHELKTPVTTLKSSIELALSKSRSTSEYKKALEENLIDVNRLSSTIRNILDLAWLGADNADFGERHFNLSNTALEIKEIAQKLALQKQIELKTDIDKNIEVSGVEDKILRAILNIVDNAISYTPNEGTVTIEFHKIKKQSVIKIKDTGVGIIKSEIPFIFQRFYRGSKTSKTLGSGLGLAIAQGIIKAHKGEIKITSRIGKGTTVTITLPLFKPSS